MVKARGTRRKPSFGVPKQSFAKTMKSKKPTIDRATLTKHANLFERASRKDYVPNIADYTHLTTVTARMRDDNARKHATNVELQTLAKAVKRHSLKGADTWSKTWRNLQPYQTGDEFPLLPAITCPHGRSCTRKNPLHIATAHGHLGGLNILSAMDNLSK